MKIKLTKEQVELLTANETAKLKQQFENEKQRLEKKLEADIKDISKKLEAELKKLDNKYKYVEVNEPKLKNSAIQQLDRESLLEMINNKMSTKEIAAKYNLKETALRQKLSKLGLTNSTKTKIDKEIIKSMVEQKKTVKEMAEYFNTSESSIRSKLWVMKIKLSETSQ